MHGTFETSGEADTEAIGECFGRTLQGGELVLLEGQLGAGKTAFVRGLARAAGVSPAEVSSPTFTLIQEYAGTRLTVFHVDLFRLAEREVPDLGLDELVAGRGVVAIEWPDRWRDRPPGAVRVAIEDLGDDRRRIRIASPVSDAGR